MGQKIDRVACVLVYGRVWGGCEREGGGGGGRREGGREGGRRRERERERGESWGPVEWDAQRGVGRRGGAGIQRKRDIRGERMGSAERNSTSGTTQKQRERKKERFIFQV